MLQVDVDQYCESGNESSINAHPERDVEETPKKLASSTTSSPESQTLNIDVTPAPTCIGLEAVQQRQNELQAAEQTEPLVERASQELSSSGDDILHLPPPLAAETVDFPSSQSMLVPQTARPQVARSLSVHTTAAALTHRPCYNRMRSEPTKRHSRRNLRASKRILGLNDAILDGSTENKPLRKSWGGEKKLHRTITPPSKQGKELAECLVQRHAAQATKVSLASLDLPVATKGKPSDYTEALRGAQTERLFSRTLAVETLPPTATKAESKEVLHSSLRKQKGKSHAAIAVDPTVTNSKKSKRAAAHECKQHTRSRSHGRAFELLSSKETTSSAPFRARSCTTPRAQHSTLDGAKQLSDSDVTAIVSDTLKISESSALSDSPALTSSVVPSFARDTTNCTAVSPASEQACRPGAEAERTSIPSASFLAAPSTNLTTECSDSVPPLNLHVLEDEEAGTGTKQHLPRSHTSRPSLHLRSNSNEDRSPVIYATSCHSPSAPAVRALNLDLKVLSQVKSRGQRAKTSRLVRKKDRLPSNAPFTQRIKKEAVLMLDKRAIPLSARKPEKQALKELLHGWKALDESLTAKSKRKQSCQMNEREGRAKRSSKPGFHDAGEMSDTGNAQSNTVASACKATRKQELKAALEEDKEKQEASCTNERSSCPYSSDSREQLSSIPSTADPVSSSKYVHSFST